MRGKIALQKTAIFRLIYIYIYAIILARKLRLSYLPRATLNLSQHLPDSRTCALVWSNHSLLISALGYLFCPGLVLLPSKVIRWGYSKGSWHLQPHLGLGLAENHWMLSLELMACTEQGQVGCDSCFHSPGADREMVSQIGFGCEMKLCTGIIIRLLGRQSRERNLNDSGNWQLVWHSNSLLKSSSSCHHSMRQSRQMGKR